MEKLKRGQKMCKNCNTINGVRSFNCKNCNHPFTMKKPPKSEMVGNKRVSTARTVDYKTLSKGDVIKVLKGSGPYHTNEDGDRTYLGNKGKYTVDRVMEDGIMAIGQHGSHEFLYMGETQQSNMLETLTRAPYKFVLLRKKEPVNG